MIRVYAHGRSFDPSEPRKRHSKMSTMADRMDKERFAITFCEATVHAGGVGQDASGKMAEHGISPRQMELLSDSINLLWPGHAEIVPLSISSWLSPESWQSTVPGHEGTRTRNDLEACVMVWRGGANDILDMANGADELFKEQCSFPYDRLYENVRQHKIFKKGARYNIEFGDVGKQQSFPSIGAKVPDINDPDFEDKMAAYQAKVTSHNKSGYFKTIDPRDTVSSVKAFDELPLLSTIREYLNGMLSQSPPFQPNQYPPLNAEGNHYYGPSSNINYHGDGERKVIICLCLGRTTELVYQCRFPEENAALQQREAGRIQAHHGDIYFMSEKAGGYDWKFGRKQWPEPRFVHGAAFDKSTLDDFMDAKRRAQERKLSKSTKKQKTSASKSND